MRITGMTIRRILLICMMKMNVAGKLSPAYDLTYSNSIGGEHATTVNGNGVNPELDDILAVAKKNWIKYDNGKENRTEYKRLC